MARGTPDEEVYQPRVMPEDLPRKITPHADAEDFGGGVARALGDVGGVLDRKLAADSATWAANQLTQLRTQAIQTLEEQKAALPADQDPSGFTQKYLKTLDPLINNAATAAGGNSVAQRMFESGLTQLRGTLQDHAIEWEAHQTVAYRADSLQRNLDSQAALVAKQPELLNSVGSTLADQANAIGGDPSVRLKYMRAIDQTLSVAAAQGLTQRDPQGMLDRLNDPKDWLLSRLTPQARAEIEHSANGLITQAQGASIVNAFRNGGPQAGAAAYNALDQSSLPDEQKAKIMEQARQGLGLLNQERRTQFAPQLTALETGIASGQPPANARAMADNLYQKYALNQEQYASLLGGIARAEKRDNTDAERLADATDAFTHHRPLDPKDTEDAKGANLLLSKLTNGQAPGSDAFANAAVSITDRVGVIPKDVTSWARASLTGGNPQEASAAANLLSRLQETNPRAYGFAIEDKETSTMAASISNAVKAGTDPAVAVNLARQNQSLSTANTAALAEQWKNTKAAQSQPGALSSLLKSDPVYKPGWFTGLPAVPPLMQGQFDQLTEEYYKHVNGNLTQARELAAQDLKRTWGVSEVNGKRELMQYAPEAMFPGLSADVVRDDIAQTVRENTEKFQGVDASKVHLTPIAETARTGGQRWGLGAPDQFGAYDVVRGKDGNPLLYEIPVAPSDYAAVRDRQAQADLQAARVKQAQGRAYQRDTGDIIDAERNAPRNRLNY